MWERDTAPGDYRFVCELTGVAQEEYDKWRAEGYGNVAATLMLTQDFGGFTDEEMVKVANLCDSEGCSIEAAIRKVKT